MFFIGILFVSNLLAKVVQTGKMIWNKVKKKKFINFNLSKETIFSVFKKSLIFFFFLIFFERFQNF